MKGARPSPTPRVANGDDLHHRWDDRACLRFLQSPHYSCTIWIFESRLDHGSCQPPSEKAAGLKVSGFALCTSSPSATTGLPPLQVSAGAKCCNIDLLATRGMFKSSNLGRLINMSKEYLVEYHMVTRNNSRIMSCERCSPSLRHAFASPKKAKIGHMLAHRIVPMKRTDIWLIH